MYWLLIPLDPNEGISGGPPQLSQVQVVFVASSCHLSGVCPKNTSDFI